MRVPGSGQSQRAFNDCLQYGFHLFGQRCDDGVDFVEGDQARLHRCSGDNGHFAGTVNYSLGQTQHRTRPEAIDLLTFNAHQAATDDQISLFDQTAGGDNFFLRLKRGGLEQGGAPKAEE